MKHLRTYKLFEAREIDDRLEFEVGDEVWVSTRYGDYDWKNIPCQVMDIKVGTDVAGSPHNEIKVYFYYVRNSETEEIRPFRSFKLSKIQNTNESTAYDDMKNIIEDASNICDDIRDDGFIVDVKPDNDIHIKMLGMYRKGTITSPPTRSIDITISKSVFWFADIQETIGRLVGYMESENFSCDVDFVTEVADRAARVSMRRPISKKVKYKEFVKLFGGGIEPWNTQTKPARQSSNKLSSIKLIFEIDSLYLLDVINQRDK